MTSGYLIPFFNARSEWGAPDRNARTVVDLCPCDPAPGTTNGCPDPCGSDFKLIEWPIYGSDSIGRIASVKPEAIWRLEGDGTTVSQPETIFTRILDEKFYELKDHLGNVRVVALDRKQPATQTGQAPYQAVLTSYSNYYAYGMLQPSRSWQAGEWRWGFNGKEMDNEVAVTGGSYDYGARMYDARVERWLSRHPYAAKFTGMSPYCGFASSAILVSDDGGDVWDVSSSTASSQRALEGLIGVCFAGKIQGIVNSSGQVQLADGSGVPVGDALYQSLSDEAKELYDVLNDAITSQSTVAMTVYDTDQPFLFDSYRMIGPIIASPPYQPGHADLADMATLPAQPSETSVSVQSVLAHAVSEQYYRQAKNYGDLGYVLAHLKGVSAEQDAGGYDRAGASMTTDRDATGEETES